MAERLQKFRYNMAKSGCFLPLSSFVIQGTKAERGFKDKVLDTSALLIGNEPVFRPLPYQGVSAAQTQWSIFPLLTMRACRGRLPAEETGPNSGLLPGEKEACGRRHGEQREGNIQGKWMHCGGKRGEEKVS